MLIKGRARKLKSARGRAYATAVAAQVLETFGKPKPLEGRIELAITLHPPTRRKCDLDNFVKSLQDSIVNAGLIGDDCQVDRLTVERGSVTAGGMAIVFISSTKSE